MARRVIHELATCPLGKVYVAAIMMSVSAALPPARAVARRLLCSLRIQSSFRLAYINALLAFGQWIEAHRGIKDFKSRYELYEYMNSRYLGNPPVEYLEFGVAEGASLRAWLEINTHPASCFFGFDT